MSLVLPAPAWPPSTGLIRSLSGPVGRDSSQDCRGSFPPGRCRCSSIASTEETTVNHAGDADWIIGVDTHLDTHTAAICDARGRAVARLQVPATRAGYTQLLAWARSAAPGSRVIWAVEGTRHYGLGLARPLAGAGEQVSEIDAGRHVGKRRAGKSDAIDAVRAARELLARPHPAQMRADG